MSIRDRILERLKEIDELCAQALELDECGSQEDVDEVYEEIRALEREVDALEGAS